MVDVRVENHGSLFLFAPETREAREWLEEHTDGQWWGGSLAVEHRFAVELAAAMLEHGFVVE